MLLSRTLLLKAEPAGTLLSIDELFALASAMEQEAATKYAELAGEMQCQKKFDLAAVFTELAAAEREHVDGVTRWSQSRRGKAPDPSLVRWEGPETFDAETATEIRTSRLMTPYRALSMAVRNEERAFAFWSYVAAFSEDCEIRTVAEAMAREELGHVSILRKERRRAYHRERDATPADQGHKVGGSTGQRQRPSHVDARTLELRLAAQLADIERRLADASAKRVHELFEETMAMSRAAASFGSFPARLEQADSQTVAEALADAYLSGAEGAGDPARLETLQSLAGRAISRLAWLRAFA
jgi:rubrerythrin